MTIYFIIIFVIILFSFCDSINVKSSNRYILLLLLTVFLVFFSAFRSNNPDWEQYVEMQQITIKSTSFVSADVSFDIICKFLNLFSDSPILMFSFYALCSVCLNVDSFRKYSPYFLISILVYFVHHYVLKDMIQIRAGLASALCLYSIRYLSNNQYKKFFIIWAIAVFTHLTAFVWLLTFFCFKYKISVKTIRLVILISFIIGFVYPLGNLIKLFAIGIDERLNYYIAYGSSGFASSLGIINNVNVWKTLFWNLWFIYYYNYYNSINRYFKGLYYAYFCGLCWMVLFNDFSIISARMSNILLCVEPVLLSMSLYSFKNTSKPFFWVVLVFYSLGIFFNNISPDKVVPYEFYFKF